MKFFPLSLIAVAVLASGCQITKPVADFRMTTREVAPEDMQVVAAREMALPNEWFSDNVSLEVEQDFQPTTDGTEVLISQRIRYTRITDPTEAAQVAMVRSEDSSDLGKAITSAGTTVLVEAIGAQFGLAVEEVRAAIERAKIEAEARRNEPAPEPSPEPAP